MKRDFSAALVSAVLFTLACSGAASSDGGSSAPPRSYGLGRPAAVEHVAALDVDVLPDGTGLPEGSGTVAQGATIYGAKCASCHGAKGEGIAPAYPPLVGRDSAMEGFAFAKDWKAPKTIGNYWPYASTVFDYVRRAMPHAAPGSLSNDETYALTAWLLAANGVIAREAALDAKSLASVKMPAAARFVRDNRRAGREVR